MILIELETNVGATIISDLVQYTCVPPIIDMKFEKYMISIETNGSAAMRIRYGFGAAGEEVQKILELAGIERVRVKIEGANPEVTFLPGGSSRLVDIKQKLKSLSFGSSDY